jgi:hypothetical protein
MKAFNIDRNGHRAGIIGQNILLMKKKLQIKNASGLTPGTIPAPSRYALKEFGGTMTIKEFRAHGDEGHFVPYPLPDEFVMLPPEIVKPTNESTQIPNCNTNKKFYEISNTKTTNETLKLKRPKPLKRDEKNLETMLGIVRKK